MFHVEDHEIYINKVSFWQSIKLKIVTFSNQWFHSRQIIKFESTVMFLVRPLPIFLSTHANTVIGIPAFWDHSLKQLVVDVLIWAVIRLHRIKVSSILCHIDEWCCRWGNSVSVTYVLPVRLMSEIISSFVANHSSMFIQTMQNTHVTPL